MIDTLHLVDPALRAALDAWNQGVTDQLAVPCANSSTTQTGRPFNIVEERRQVPGPAGSPEVSLEIFRPADMKGTMPAIYHIHGGGYVSGSVAQFSFLHRDLVRELGCVVISVDYRLAPDHVFPAALDDCYAGLQWTFCHAGELGLDTDRVGVMGESAGGGLAASLAQLVRDRGEVALAFQHLTYPMIDDRTCTRADPHPYSGQFVWSNKHNRFGWKAFLGTEPGALELPPYAAAARTENLSGLPPTYILVGALDLFVEESVDYAMRLLRTGVPTELHVLPGAFHGFDIISDAPISRAAHDSRLLALRAALDRKEKLSPAR